MYSISEGSIPFGITFVPDTSKPSMVFTVQRLLLGYLTVYHIIETRGVVGVETTDLELRDAITIVHGGGLADLEENRIDTFIDVNVDTCLWKCYMDARCHAVEYNPAANHCSLSKIYTYTETRVGSISAHGFIHENSRGCLRLYCRDEDECTLVDHEERCRTKTVTDLLEPVYKSDGECYGVARTINVTCPASTSIAMDVITVGMYPTSHGVCNGTQSAGDGTGCCDTAADTCEFTYTNPNGQYQKTCNGEQTCSPNPERLEIAHGACNASIYPAISHYMLFDYFCVQDSRSDSMSGTQLSVLDEALYLQSPGYPMSDISSSVTDLSCSVETDDCSAAIAVYVIERKLGDYTNTTTPCQQNQNLSIIEPDTTVLVQWTCDDNTHTITQPLQSTDTYITVNFTNTMTTDGGRFWIGFKATTTANLTVDCPAKERQYCHPTTTTSTTSTTTTATTTTTTTPTTITTTTTTTTTPTTTPTTTTATTTAPTTTTTTAANVTEPLISSPSESPKSSTTMIIVALSCLGGVFVITTIIGLIVCSREKRKTEPSDRRPFVVDEESLDRKPQTDPSISSGTGTNVLKSEPVSVVEKVEKEDETFLEKRPSTPEKDAELSQDKANVQDTAPRDNVDDHDRDEEADISRSDGDTPVENNGETGSVDDAREPSPIIAPVPVIIPNKVDDDVLSDHGNTTEDDENDTALTKTDMIENEVDDTSPRTSATYTDGESASIKSDDGKTSVNETDFIPSDIQKEGDMTGDIIHVSPTDSGRATALSNLSEEDIVITKQPTVSKATDLNVNKPDSPRPGNENEKDRHIMAWSEGTTEGKTDNVEINETQTSTAKESDQQLLAKTENRQKKRKPRKPKREEKSVDMAEVSASGNSVKPSTSKDVDDTETQYIETEGHKRTPLTDNTSGIATGNVEGIIERSQKAPKAEPTKYERVQRSIIRGMFSDDIIERKINRLKKKHSMKSRRKRNAIKPVVNETEDL